MMNLRSMNSMRGDSSFWWNDSINICEKESLNSINYSNYNELKEVFDSIEHKAREIDAEIIITKGKRYKSDMGKYFYIKFKGKKSKISYRITGIYEPLITNLIYKRLNELSANERTDKDDVGIMLDGQFQFDVAWFDILEKNWRKFDHSGEHYGTDLDLGFIECKKHWIVDIMDFLHKDVISSLEPDMGKLREMLVEALPQYWFVNEQVDNITFDDIASLSERYIDLALISNLREKSKYTSKLNTIKKLIKKMY